MYETLENFINEIIIEKPELRELIAVFYSEADESKKKALQEFLQDKDKEDLKNRALQILNSESMEVLDENIKELFKDYPSLKGFRDFLFFQRNFNILKFFKKSKNLVIFDKLRKIVSEREESAHDDDDFYKLFLQTYPEFKAVPYEVVCDMFLKITCIYPKYKDLEQTSEAIPPEVYPFFMLVAHYLCIEGKAEIAGFNRSAGVVSSSSIDGVSVSYVAPPLKDNFQYFFSKTPYGQEYLAYISTNNVMMYV